MAAKRLLIADPDSRNWEEFRQALDESWEVVGATTCAEALAESEKHAFSVVVANSELPEAGGADLLNRIRASNPKSMRFIAADAAMKDKIMAQVLGGDQFLAIPFDRAYIKNLIERSVADDYGMSNSVRELVGRMRSFPTIPSLYLEVVSALNSPNATTADIGAIIAKDMSMTTKLMQVINSAYFGLPRTITDASEAVGILGFETVKSLIMTVKLLSQYDKVKPVYFSIDSIWRHSTTVARTARVMALLETNSTECSALAYTGGLMHDLGKVILAANFDDQYHGAHTVARKQQIPLWEVEKDIFGATHGEIGGYLLALWGLPPEVVKVAALHHHPTRSDDKCFTALTAVHVANVLEYEKNPEPDGLPAPVVDSTYLLQLGMADRVDMWRFARRESEAAKSDTKFRHNRTAFRQAAAAATPASEPASQLETPEPAALPATALVLNDWWKWLGLGLGAVAALVCVVWLAVSRFERTAQKPVNQKIAEVITPSTPVEAPAAAPVPAARIASVPAVPPAPAPEKKGFDRVRLEAIFFSRKNPSVLLNGKLAGLNQEIAECRVLDISPNSVTLQYQNQLKTLSLR